MLILPHVGDVLIDKISDRSTNFQTINLVSRWPFLFFFSIILHLSISLSPLSLSICVDGEHSNKIPLQKMKNEVLRNRTIESIKLFDLPFCPQS